MGDVKPIEFLENKKHSNAIFEAASLCGHDLIRKERSLIRYDLLYTLSAKLPFGRIVELGAGVGMDSVPLMHGVGDRVGMHIHVVDWYQDCAGINGDVYDRGDHKIFRRVVEATKLSHEPIVYIQSFAKFIRDWGYPIGMLIWDGNVMPPKDDLSSLEPYITPGGWMVLVDTINRDWGLEDIAYAYDDSGFYTIYQESITAKNRIYTLRKKVKK